MTLTICDECGGKMDYPTRINNAGKSGDKYTFTYTISLSSGKEGRLDICDECAIKIFEKSYITTVREKY